MEFVVGFTQTQRQNDFIWVVVDKLTNIGHFIPIKCNYSVEDYAMIFIDEIVRLHGIHLFII